MIAGMSPKLFLPLLVAVAAAFTSSPAAERAILDDIVANYEHHTFVLAVDLHLPLPFGQPAPSIDVKGWHHNETSRPIVLHAGDAVEVTAVLNYGDKGVFLEISSLQRTGGDELPPHVRVRFASDAPPEKADVQAKDLATLLGHVLHAPKP
jgi:hypothetical protein